MSDRLSFLDRTKQFHLAMPRSWPAITKHVATVLFTFAGMDDGGGITASIETLANHAGEPRANVCRALAFLEKAGFLEHDDRFTYKNGLTTRTRRLALEKIAAARRDQPVPSMGPVPPAAEPVPPVRCDTRPTSETQTERKKNREITETPLTSFGTRAREEDDVPVIQTQRKETAERDHQPASETQRPRHGALVVDRHRPVVAPAQPPAQSAAGSSGTPRRAGQRSATRCPADWQPGPDLVAFGLSERFSEAEIARQAAAMRDWSLSSPAGRKLDWDRTFRNWLRRAADGQRPRTVVVEKTVTLAPRPASGQEQAIANLRAKLAATGSLFDPPAVFGHAD